MMTPVQQVVMAVIQITVLISIILLILVWNSMVCIDFINLF